MSAVGLVYVGIVLVLNGLMLLGWVTPREAGPLNLFVGVLQVVTPTYLIIVAAGDMEQIFAASGIYLFGFTYLWVGINAYTGHSNRGLGWFSLLVALCTLVYATDSFIAVGDPGFGMIWLLWGILWLHFFLVLGLELDALGPPTGFFTLVTGLVTGGAAFLTLIDRWTGDWLAALVVAVLGAAALVASAPAAKRFSPPAQGVVD